MSEMYPEQPAPAQPEPFTVQRFICLACGAQFGALLEGGIPPHTRSTPVSTVSGDRFQINCEGSGSLPSVRSEEPQLPQDPWAAPGPGGVTPTEVPVTRSGLLAQVATDAIQASPDWQDGDTMLVVVVSKEGERSLSFCDMPPERASQELMNAANVVLASHPGPWRYVVGRICAN